MIMKFGIVIAMPVQSIFFVYKYIKIKFFYFLKIIFDISISKQFENIKKIILNK
jgi:hypothetical protein